MSINILNRYTGAILYSSETADSIAAAVVEAVQSSADLRSADLRSANLSSADLSGADLRSADLSNANLRSANLYGADLSNANLSNANLSSANLRSANLRSANLESIRQDFIAEVLRLPNELEFLRAAIVEGRINGSTYDGECACLAGTLAKAKGIESYSGGAIVNGCTFRGDSSSPRERFFLAIKPGDKPESNGASAIALEWTDEAIAIRDNIRRSAGAA